MSFDSWTKPVEVAQARGRPEDVSEHPRMLSTTATVTVRLRRRNARNAPGFDFSRAPMRRDNSPAKQQVLGVRALSRIALALRTSRPGRPDLWSIDNVSTSKPNMPRRYHPWPSYIRSLFSPYGHAVWIGLKRPASLSKLQTRSIVSALKYSGFKERESMRSSALNVPP